MLRGRVAEAGCAIAYVNQVGGQDELVFDGDSLVVAADGTLVASGAQFAEDLVVVDLPVGPHRPHGRHRAAAAGRGDRAPPGERPAAGAGAAAPAAERPRRGLRGARPRHARLPAQERVHRGGHRPVGRHRLVAGGHHRRRRARARRACTASSMPSRYSSEGSRDDAEVLAERLGIDLKVVPIEEAHVAFASMLAPVLGREPFGLTDENLQSRLRGVLLMAVSNAKGWIVLTTGNKSEMATGYSTLYGDSAGGFAVIKDVPKTLVYELCRYRNTQAVLEGLPGPIPDSVLDKPPSAELRPDQRDDQSLPPYEELDPVLQGYVERDRTAADLVAEGFDPAVVDRVVRLVDGAEYKRRQMPPGVRITTKAFGKDRRMPITNRYRSSALEESGGG